MKTDFSSLQDNEIIVTYDISQNNKAFRDELQNLLTEVWHGQKLTDTQYRIHFAPNYEAMPFLQKFMMFLDDRMKHNDKIILIIKAPGHRTPEKRTWIVTFTE
jgi:hypothetical protein